MYSQNHLKVLPEMLLIYLSAYFYNILLSAFCTQHILPCISHEMKVKNADGSAVDFGGSCSTAGKSKTGGSTTAVAPRMYVFVPVLPTL